MMNVTWRHIDQPVKHLTVGHATSYFDNFCRDGNLLFLIVLVLIHRINCTNTHTHSRLTALFPGLPGRAGTRKAKPIWILLKQETVSGNAISWAICKSAPCSRQTTTPAPQPLCFLQAGCPSCRPTNSVKALIVLIHAELNSFRQCTIKIHYKH